MKVLDYSVSERISILRYVMIFGIIVLHTPLYVPLPDTGPSAFDFIKALMQHAIFRTSVPVLTCISGFLLYRANMDRSYKTLFTKKVRTILIPLFLFNSPIAVAVYILQANHLSGHTFSVQLYPFEVRNWIDATIGLFGSPVNYPLNFLRDLFLISIGAPIFGFFLRRLPWAGLLVVFVIFWNNLDGSLVLRNTMPITFYLGGMAAVLNWDLRKLDPYAAALALFFLGVCVITIAFQIENRNFLRIISPILIWPAASVLLGSRLGTRISQLSKYSFATFLLHGPMLLLAWLLYQKYLSRVPYYIFWMGTPVIIAMLVIPIYTYCYRFFPRTTRFALGGR